MKRVIALVLSMVFALLTGCGTTAAPPVSEPEPAPVSVSEPPPPTFVEGVVKEASPGKIVVTLADGTEFALDTAGISDLKVNPGDTVKVEYTGAPGSAVAGKVDVTKAAPVFVTVTGIVKEATASMMLLVLEDETELVLLTKDIEGLEVKAGDKVTAEYSKDDNGAVAAAVEVTEPAIPEDTASDTGASSQTAAPAAPASSAGGSSASAPASSAQPGTSSGTDSYDIGAAIWGWLEEVGATEDTGYEDEDDAPSGEPEQPTESQPEEEPEPEPEPDEDACDVYEAIRLINSERTKAGLAELTIDDDIMSMAAVRAEEIASRYEHTRPDGRKWSTVFDDYGWEPNMRAENIYASPKSAEAAVSGWMDSSGHKANILKSNATKIGLGYYYDSESRWKHFWVMLVSG